MQPQLAIAIKAARKAGSIINRASLEPEKIKVSKKDSGDYVTDIDTAVEEAIINVLLEAYPEHSILGEETGGQKGQNTDHVWIIDPIDGTNNFVHGTPNYAVSIALAHRGQIVQACIYDPSRNELFTASRGSGAFLNDRRIRVSGVKSLSDALVSARFPHTKNDSVEDYANKSKDLIMHSGGFRRLGSTVLELAYVACGRFDAYFGAGLQNWDIAAATLLIVEAGGLVGDFQGEQTWKQTGNMIASTPKLFPHLINHFK